MKKIRFYILLALIVCIAYTASAETNNAQPASGKSAVLAESQGTVEMKPSTKKAVWVAAVANTSLVQGDIIRAGEKSSATIHINWSSSNAVIELKENSQITLVELAQATSGGHHSSLVSLDIGEALINTKKLEKGSVFEIKTPTSIIASQGDNSSFTVKVEKVE